MSYILFTSHQQLYITWLYSFSCFYIIWFFFQNSHASPWWWFANLYLYLYLLIKEVRFLPIFFVRFFFTPIFLPKLQYMPPPTWNNVCSNWTRPSSSHFGIRLPPPAVGTESSAADLPRPRDPARPAPEHPSPTSPDAGRCDVGRTPPSRSISSWRWGEDKVGVGHTSSTSRKVPRRS
jgi:hypothetical protein